MYHSNANKYNISWDTLSPDREDCGNGTKFRTDTKGVLIRQMDYMTKMRNEFKSLMKLPLIISRNGTPCSSQPRRL